LIHGLAVNYHWSESEILGLPWDRAIAYLKEIQIDAGKSPDRKEPVLPEEERYDRLLLKEKKRESSA